VDAGSSAAEGVDSGCVFSPVSGLQLASLFASS
jgi:hypothetical protein